MEKVNEIPASPLDIFLLPVWVHKKLSISLKSLILAFLFVGSFDMLFFPEFKLTFFKGSVPEIALKLFVFMLLSFIIGAIDVICTMVPIAEFAVMIGKRSEKFVDKRMPVILMKSYALSHLIFVIPYAVWNFSGIDWLNVGVDSPSQIRMIFAILITVMNFLPLIQYGIIYRTISIRTRLQVFGKLILILATYFWIGLSTDAIIFFEILFQSLLRGM